MLHSHGTCIVMSQFNSYLTYRKNLLFLKWKGIVFVAASFHNNKKTWNLTPTSVIASLQGFLRCCRNPIRVPRIENGVARIRENNHQVPRIRENRVPTGPYRVPNIFPKKTCFTAMYLSKLPENFTIFFLMYH